MASGDRAEPRDGGLSAQDPLRTRAQPEGLMFAVLSQGFYFRSQSFLGAVSPAKKTHISMVFRIKWWVRKDGARGAFQRITGQSPGGPDHEQPG